METDQDTPPQLAWGDNFILGFAPMDDLHREFVDLVAAVQGASDDQVLARLDALAAHCDEHFDQENQWMRDTDFPPRDCHIDEHAAVMASMRAVRAKVADGDAAEGRRLVQALADWFPGHADYLDSALSHWMFKRRFGGKPIVLRRDAAAGHATEPVGSKGAPPTPAG